MNEKKKKKLKFSDCLINMYISIKNNNLNFNKLNIFCNIFEIINHLMIIDIIFNYKRNFFNIFTYLYILSPNFYFELINNQLCKNVENLNKDYYKYDQISLLLDKFKMKIFEQKNFKNLNIIKIILIFFIYFFIIIQAVNVRNSILNLFKFIASRILYIFFNPLLSLILFIFLRNFFIQITDNYNDLGEDIFFDILLFILILIPIYFMFNLFIYAYDRNELYYYFNSKIFYLKFTLSIIESIILILRFDLKFSIVFQISWVFIYMIIFLEKIKIFEFNLYKTINDHLYIIFHNIIFSFLVARFIFVFLAKKLEDITILKYFEIIAIFIIFVIISFLVNQKKIILLSDLENLLDNNVLYFILGLFQIFEPLNRILLFSSHKIVEKDKNNVFKMMQKNFKKYFCIEIYDYEILCKNKEEKETLTKDDKFIKKIREQYDININDFQKLLLFIIKYLINIIKSKKDFNHYHKCKELLTYYKILYYNISEENKSKVYFLLKKINNKILKKSNDILSISIFTFLNSHFIKYQRLSDDNNLDYIIIFLKLNSKYLKIVKSLKFVITNFSRDRAELLEMTNKHNKQIEKNFKKILDLFRLIKDSSRIKENIEYDKFQLLEAILFNSGYEKTLDNFDLQNLDLIIEKNTFFILSYVNNELIIKKTPLNYYEITNNKSGFLKKHNFFDIFPECLKLWMKKEIKNWILSDNLSKINTCIKKKNDLLLLVKLYMIKLPTICNNYYIGIGLEYNSKKDNSLIINNNGKIISFGYYFSDFFSVNLNDKMQSFFKLLNLKNFNLDNIENNSKILELNPKKLYSNIKKNILLNQTNIFENSKKLEEMRYNFHIVKVIKITLIIVKKFEFNDEKLYLIDFEVDNFNKNKFTTTKIDEKQSQSGTENNQNFTFSGGSVASSVANIDLNKEKDWNITNESNNNTMFNLRNNHLGNISFYYNFFVISLSIIFSIVIKILTKNFKGDINHCFAFRDINSNFYYNQFYFINKIIITSNYIENNFYNIISEELEENEINFNLTKFFFIQNQERAKNQIEYFNNYLKPAYIKISTDKIRDIMNFEVEILNIEGEIIKQNYMDFFPIQMQYNYILSQISEYYIEIPLISYENKNQISNLNNLPQKYVYFIIANSHTFIKVIFLINSSIKEIYDNSMIKLRIFIILILIIFLVCNLISLTLLFFSVKIQNEKIFKVIHTISKIENNHINYLKKKLKLTKLLIHNELKASEIIENLKNYALESGIKLKHRKQMNKESNNLLALQSMGYDTKNLQTNNNENKKNNQLNLPTQKPIIITSSTSKFSKLKLYYSVIITLLILIIIYGCLFGIIIPLSISLLSEINQKLDEITSIQDLQDLLLSYYLIIKYSIYLNTTLYDEYFNLTQLYASIFDNYTLIMSNIRDEKGNKYESLLESLNKDDKCNKLLYELKDNEADLIELCKYYNVFNTNVYTIQAGLILTLKETFNRYKHYGKEEVDLILLFHSENLQFINLIIIIFAMDNLMEIYNNYFLSDFFNNLKKLEEYLIILFITMVVIEIVNYFQSKYFIIEKKSNEINNYYILEKFLVIKEDEKKEK